jgi:hypothetical protein
MKGENDAIEISDLAGIEEVILFGFYLIVAG